MTDIRDELVAEMRDWAAKVDAWTTQHRRAVATRDELEATAGELVLADPEQAESISDRLSRRRTEVDVMAQTLAAAQPRLEAAQRAVLEYDVATLEAEAEAAQQALDDHERKVLNAARRAAQLAGAELPVEVPRSTKAAELERAVELAQVRVDVVRDVMVGVDPATTISGALTERPWSVNPLRGMATEDFHPACVWGPNAVIPAPAFQRRVDSRLSAIAAHDADTLRDDEKIIATLQESIDRWDALEADERARLLVVPPLSLSELAQARNHCRLEIQARREWRKDAPKIRAGLVGDLAELVGPDRAVEMAERVR